jgi:hypothetical protein
VTTSACVRQAATHTRETQKRRGCGDGGFSWHDAAQEFLQFGGDQVKEGRGPRRSRTQPNHALAATLTVNEVWSGRNARQYFHRDGLDSGSDPKAASLLRAMRCVLPLHMAAKLIPIGGDRLREWRKR